MTQFLALRVLGICYEFVMIIFQGHFECIKLKRVGFLCPVSRSLNGLTPKMNFKQKFQY